jgi:hypothetical protein
MNRSFPIFSSHLDLAHHYWKLLLKQGDAIIDATCGNGKDTLELASLILRENSGTLIGLDIQPQALIETSERLKENFNISQLNNVHLFQQSHDEFPLIAYEKKIKLIVYNLGYLPGGDKKITTQVETTLKSIRKSLELIVSGGALSITCYPGHEEGKHEQAAIIQLLSELDPKIWSCSFHQWLNRSSSPSLAFLQKTL